MLTPESVYAINNPTFLICHLAEVLRKKTKDTLESGKINLLTKASVYKADSGSYVNEFIFMKAILAKKVGMTTVFEADGTAYPATVLKAGPCTVTFVRPVEGEGTNVQLGYEEAKEKHLTKPERGHLKDLSLLKHLREFRFAEGDDVPQKGDKVEVSSFAVGDKVKVTGHSKGKGFQGVVKRHGFSGSLATHGHRHDHRAPGSIGATGISRVLKGTRMAGRMGGEKVTVEGLTVIDVKPEENLLVVKGAVPGHKNTLLKVKSEGTNET